jgi:hypothetical protein
LLSLLFGAAFSHIPTIGLGSAFLLNLIGAGWKTRCDHNFRHTSRRTSGRTTLALVTFATPSSHDWEYYFQV